MKQLYIYSKDGVKVTVILDVRRKKINGLYPAKIQVTCRGRRSYFPTGKDLTVEDWDNLASSRKLSVGYVRKDIQNSFDLVRKAVEDLTSHGAFTIERLNTRIKSISTNTINEVAEAKITKLKEQGRIGTAGVYQALLNRIQRYAGGGVSFAEITPDWLNRYEDFLRAEGKKQTTIAIEMRTLRALFNDAIRELIVSEAAYPFGRGKYEIQEGTGRKLALSLENIGRIARYKTPYAAKRKYRDYWMFLYLCNGLNVADFCRLKYSDIVGGEIIFLRQKTIRTSKKLSEIRVPISPEMAEIIKNHGNISRAGYIFPIFRGGETPEQIKLKTQYTTRAINKHMAEISRELDIPHISTYTARHSFATVLKRAGINIAYISESLGHSDIKTTENYLAGFEREEREKNAKLLTQY